MRKLVSNLLKTSHFKMVYVILKLLRPKTYRTWQISSIKKYIVVSINEQNINVYIKIRICLLLVRWVFTVCSRDKMFKLYGTQVDIRCLLYFITIALSNLNGQMTGLFGLRYRWRRIIHILRLVIESTWWHFSLKNL